MIAANAAICPERGPVRRLLFLPLAPSPDGRRPSATDRRAERSRSPERDKRSYAAVPAVSFGSARHGRRVPRVDH
jgi:hypothetical protein